MSPIAIQPGSIPPAASARANQIASADESRPFESVLRSANCNDRATLQDAATKLVSTAFVMPVLESMTSSGLRPAQGPFAMGGAEKRFAPLLHQEFADRITKSANFGLIDSIVDRFQAHLEKGSHV